MLRSSYLPSRFRYCFPLQLSTFQFIEAISSCSGDRFLHAKKVCLHARAIALHRTDLLSSDVSNSESRRFFVTIDLVFRTSAPPLSVRHCNTSMGVPSMTTLQLFSPLFSEIPTHTSVATCSGILGSR